MSDTMKNEIEDFGVGLTEAILDQFINDPLVKDFPLISTAISIAKLGKSIADRIFLVKINHFLSSISISEKERKTFSKKLDSDPKLKAKTAEICLFIINRSDDLEKLSITGSLFQSFIKNQIDISIFKRLSNSIDLAFIDDLRLFIDTHGTDDDCYEFLLRTGLTKITGVSMQWGGSGNRKILCTDLGELLINIMEENPLKSHTQ